MNALIKLFLLFLGLANPQAKHQGNALEIQSASGVITMPQGNSSDNQILGSDHTRNNPRTVVALEDTHFRPAN